MKLPAASKLKDLKRFRKESEALHLMTIDLEMEETEPMMKAEDVLGLYNALERSGVQIWVDGGWGIDALLGKETRQHRDLDIAIQQKDVGQLRELLKGLGYEEIRLEIARPHNFVLGNPNGKEVDVHVIVFDGEGNGIYGPVENGGMYPARG